MTTAMPAKQHGLSFSGFIAGVVVLVIVSIFGLKLIPAYMQDARIKNLFTVIANDPDMQKATPRDIRLSFEKRAEIDDVRAIKAEDIQIDKDGERLVLSASYPVLIPLVANISLYLEFKPSNAGK